MIKLNFKIDDKYLIFHTLVNSKKERFVNEIIHDDVVAFQNYAWEQSQMGYNFLRFGIDVKNIISGNQTITESAQQAEDLLNSLVKSPMYKKIKTQSEDALLKVKVEWENNYEKSYQVINELIGMELEDTFDVYITHPSQKTGRNLGNNILLWTYRTDWSCYNTVYLWHEIMHSYIERSDIGHAVIELVTDNELRVRLNNSSYPPFEGHNYLDELRTKLLSHWKNYVKESNKNIIKFIEEMKTIYK